MNTGERERFARVVAANRYLVLGTTDADGRPWLSPVFFAPLGDDRLCWVSSADSRHSRNLAERPEIAITVFDSTVAVGHAEAAYVEAAAAPAPAAETSAVLAALNARLPEDRSLAPDDLVPPGPLTAYIARIDRRYVLVRGGDPERGNVLDTTVELGAEDAR
ncbi:MAG: pyridoxamine 5'-phosphate oxidase family protein [Leifsonia sp.]|uniref:pyridoxamine 5'-phosphate oxidase family protein n=1 Tax=Leifsonia sp. TaxID=1870902 RepID=UPI003F80A277